MPSVRNKTFDEIGLGDTASVQRSLQARDIRAWAAAFGDVDPCTEAGDLQSAAGIVTAILASLAVEYFVYAMAKYTGAYAAVLGGLDAFVFTAGIGENSAPVRAALCRRLAWLGVKLDEPANASGGPRISTPDSAVSVWVIPTNEELMIAQHTLALVKGAL